jgi:AcrR family transcriptional regulator
MTPDLPKVLPRGRHAAPRHVVEASQRTRLLEAMAAVVAQRGYAATAVADVIRAAGVSRKTFYEHFTNKEDCFLQAYELGVQLLLEAIEAAQAEHAHDPLSAADAGVRAYLATLASRPEFARTFLIEAHAAGPAVHERRAEVLLRFEEQLRRVSDEVRRRNPQLPAPPDHRYRAVVGANNELVTEHVRVHGPAGVEALHERLLDVTLALLVGPG